ncbi:MAG: hypothetical protein ABSB35_10095 [Bryobacteraceae bacterium]|jgi:hypothetical protein
MRPLWQAAVLVSLLSVPGWSTTILYSNGPINGSLGAYPIGYEVDFTVTDSFVISSSSTVTGISNIGLWDNPYNPPINELNWVISTSPDGGGSVLGFANGATLSNTYLFYNGAAVYSASFSVNNLSLSAGT